jgi:general stress protein 26
MNPSELTSKAKKVINDILYITIATCNKNGQPWNSPVYSAFDENYNFYWASWKENQHSKNVKENEKVFVVIYDSTVPESTGFGVYMRGKARQLEAKDVVEIVKSLKLLYSRKTKKPRKPEEFLGILPRRIYKFVPEQVWVNSEGEVKGYFVDSRIDITSDILKK